MDNISAPVDLLYPIILSLFHPFIRHCSQLSVSVYLSKSCLVSQARTTRAEFERLPLYSSFSHFLCVFLFLLLLSIASSLEISSIFFLVCSISFQQFKTFLLIVCFVLSYQHIICDISFFSFYIFFHP